MSDNPNSGEGYDFSVSASEEAAKKAAQAFALKYIKPHMAAWDNAQEFPRETFKRSGSTGLLGTLIPAEFGGSGSGYPEYVNIITELSKVCGAFAYSAVAHSLCSGHILAFGNDEQKKKWLPGLADGTLTGAWAVSEANAGSETLNIETTAVAEGDHYIVDGIKNRVTNGLSADVAVVLVRTGAKKDPSGISALIIEKGTAGFSYGKKADKLGMRASETVELIFDHCRIPKSQLLGKEGEGYGQVIRISEHGRISLAALSLGIAKGAFEAAVNYSKQRRQFGQPVSNFQAISFKLADLATGIEAAELLIMQAADKKNRGQNVDKEASIAKYFASELAVKAATEAVQIFGGNGYDKDYPVEKFYRDAKLCTIEAGTSEIQKVLISREILG